MSVPFTCPFCGFSRTIDDRYLGQTGPCVSCGETITVSGTAIEKPPANPPGQQPRASLPLGMAVAGTLATSLALLLILAALLFPLLHMFHQRAQQTTSQQKLGRIVNALLNYQQKHGSFPPAYVTDAAGQALYSWRVLILPELGEPGIYAAFDKTKAWNAPENVAMSQATVSHYLRDADLNTTSFGTNYYVFVGPRTAFPAAKGLPQITDSLSQTLLVYEAAEKIGSSWAQPHDAIVGRTTPTFGSGPRDIRPLQSGGIHIGLADGTVRFLTLAELEKWLDPLMNPHDSVYLSDF